MSIDHLRQRLLEGIHGCKTLDCYLIRISSLIYDLEDVAKTPQGIDRKYVEEMLREIITKTTTQLQPLACNMGATIELIDTDPRFKNIKKYREELINILNNIKCTQPKPIPIKNLTPPPYIYEETYHRIEEKPVQKQPITERIRGQIHPRIKPGIHWAALVITIFLFISLFLPWYEISYTVNGETLASAGITPIGAIKYYYKGDTSEINRFVEALPVLDREAAKTWALKFLEDLKTFIYMIIAAFITTGISTIYRKAGRITILIYALILIGYPLMIAWNYGTEYLHTTTNIFGIQLSIGISWGYLILLAPIILELIFKD